MEQHIYARAECEKKRAISHRKTDKLGLGTNDELGYLNRDLQRTGNFNPHLNTSYESNEFKLESTGGDENVEGL